MFDSTYDSSSYDDGYYENNSTDYSGFEMFVDDDESHDNDNDEQGWDEYDSWDEDYDDSMDGDFDTGMRDAGFGTDEDYGYYGEDY